jgi:general stress protein CsbA
MFAKCQNFSIKEKQQSLNSILFPTALALVLAVFALMSKEVGTALAEEPIQVKTIEASPQVTFDLEAVHQYFDTVWVIEADTVDMKRSEAVTDSNDPQVTFKREPVQAYFDNEWVIEVDTIDVNPSLWAARETVSPGRITFDLNAVREYFDEEWVIEADAVDMGLDHLVYGG